MKTLKYKIKFCRISKSLICSFFREVEFNIIDSTIISQCNLPIDAISTNDLGKILEVKVRYEDTREIDIKEEDILKALMYKKKRRSISFVFDRWKKLEENYRINMREASDNDDYQAAANYKKRIEELSYCIQDLEEFKKRDQII